MVRQINMFSKQWMLCAPDLRWKRTILTVKSKNPKYQALLGYGIMSVPLELLALCTVMAPLMTKPIWRFNTTFFLGTTMHILRRRCKTIFCTKRGWGCWPAHAQNPKDSPLTSRCQTPQYTVHSGVPWATPRGARTALAAQGEPKT